MQSERVESCSSPNMVLTRAKTLSDMAELGRNVKMIFAARDQAGMVVAWVRKNVRMPVEKASTSAVSNVGACERKRWEMRGWERKLMVPNVELWAERAEPPVPQQGGSEAARAARRAPCPGAPPDQSIWCGCALLSNIWVWLHVAELKMCGSGCGLSVGMWAVGSS